MNEIWVGDAVELLAGLDPFVDLIVTSPPYDKMRRYKGYTFNIETMAPALSAVLKKGGVLVWVVGDQVVKGSETGTSFRHVFAFMDCGLRLHDTMIYSKTAAHPASRKSNRYSQIFEYMFVFSKGKPKTHKLLCDKENKWAGWKNWGNQTQREKDGTLSQGKDHVVPELSPRGNIWYYPNEARSRNRLKYKHPATFPDKLAEDHILTWSKPGDLVMDPMCGSGTTLRMAVRNDRRFFGIDISEEYANDAATGVEREIAKSEQARGGK